MRKLIISACVFIIAALAPFIACSAQDIRVFVNGGEVDFGGSAPVIKNSRTLAPARSVFGSAGAEIAWDALNKKVSVTIDGRTMELWVGNKQVKYSTSEGAKLIMSDAAPEIIDGSTYVPLSIIAETLGGSVEWNDTERAAYFSIGERSQADAEESQEITEEPIQAEAPQAPEEQDVTAQDTTETPIAIERKGEYDIEGLPFEMVVSGLSVSFGDTVEEMTGSLGKSDFQAESVYGYSWHEFNSGRDIYALAGVNSGSVVALYTNSKKAPVAGIVPGMSAAQLNAAVGAELELESKSKIISADGIITVYRSAIDDYSVIGVMVQKTGFTSPLLTKISNNFYNDSTERQLAGLINTERLNRGVNALKKDEKLSQTARAHSASMAQGNYLSSTDTSGKTAFERMDANNVGAYEMASENIGRGVMDAFEMYFEWMNDRSYSVNILDDHYNYFGVGVAPCPNNHKMYFTVDFIER